MIEKQETICVYYHRAGILKHWDLRRPSKPTAGVFTHRIWIGFYNTLHFGYRTMSLLANTNETTESLDVGDTFVVCTKLRAALVPILPPETRFFVLGVTKVGYRK